MKKLLLDTADLSAISKFAWNPAVAGVTTNPSLVAGQAPKGDYDDFLRSVKAALLSSARAFARPRHLSVEVTEDTPEKMLAQARRMPALIGDEKIDLFVKIPIGLDYFDLIKEASRYVNVNATAAITAVQALLAQESGASVVSFFYNRGLDGDVDMAKEISTYSQFLREHGSQERAALLATSGFPTSIICGSIRHVEDVLACWRAGADFVTVSPLILRKLSDHQKTIEAVRNFNKDFASWRS